MWYWLAAYRARTFFPSGDNVSQCKQVVWIIWCKPDLGANRPKAGGNLFSTMIGNAQFVCFVGGQGRGTG
jgi:hypothetical protein